MDSINDDNDWFIVKDLDGLINSARILVFNNFGKNNTSPDPLSMKIDDTDKEELDQLLSFDESKAIVTSLLKRQNHKIKKKIRYLLNDNIFLEIISSLNDRMVSNVLGGLVKKGLVETAYDSESNDFVFWIKNDEPNKSTETN
jgi:hypothetical protein